MWIVIAQQNGSTPLPDPLTPRAALILVVVAFAVGYGFYRLSRVRTLSRFRPYLIFGVVASWGIGIIEGVFAVSQILTPSWFALSLFLLTLVAATNYQWMRNVMAGMALSFENRLDLGDSIRVGDYEGAIREFGLRSVEIRGTDGRRHEIPNSKLVDESVSNLARGGDSVCDVTVTVPEGVTPRRARSAGREAALVSPLASPHREPEVYIEPPDAGDDPPKLRVRGYVFDAAHQERFESDVTERLFDLLDADREA